jgi:hypothetical protein
MRLSTEFIEWSEFCGKRRLESHTILRGVNYFLSVLPITSHVGEIRCTGWNCFENKEPACRICIIRDGLPLLQTYHHLWIEISFGSIRWAWSPSLEQETMQRVPRYHMTSKLGAWIPSSRTVQESQLKAVMLVHCPGIWWSGHHST